MTTTLTPPSTLAIPELSPEQLTTGLESCGLVAADTAAALSRIAAGQSLKDVTRRIADGATAPQLVLGWKLRRRRGASLKARLA